MKTAVYTICKNEYDNLERWLYYGEQYDYRVILDTGSTDGTWEFLQNKSTIDKNLIINQKIIAPWNFSEARNFNLGMVPQDVDWCLSPDLDEFFTINTLGVLYATINKYPGITNLACDRMDIYSDIPRIGPPNFLPTNKIHRRHDYIWVQPIYEHLRWNKSGAETEIYANDIYLIHDQNFKSSNRSELYFKMLFEEYEHNPRNTWCLWFLVNHYYKNKDLNMFINTACDFVSYHTDKLDKKYVEILTELKNIYHHRPGAGRAQAGRSACADSGAHARAGDPDPQGCGQVRVRSWPQVRPGLWRCGLRQAA